MREIFILHHVENDSFKLYHLMRIIMYTRIGVIDYNNTGIMCQPRRNRNLCKCDTGNDDYLDVFLDGEKSHSGLFVRPMASIYHSSVCFSPPIQSVTSSSISQEVACSLTEN